MRQILICICSFFLTIQTKAQIQVTVNLGKDSTITTTKELFFSISSNDENVYAFHYDRFPGQAAMGTDLYQHSQSINEGNYKINVAIEKDRKQAFTDSLIIDTSTARVEIFILLSTDKSSADYIKEVKYLYFKKATSNIAFSVIDSLKPGSKASFLIQNKSDKSFVGYPNNAFFFGTLYENIGEDSWTQHYPLDLNYKFCDTVSKTQQIMKGQQTIAWTPNDKDCSAYRFVKSGKYFFQLLYTEYATPLITTRNRANTIKAVVYREIFFFVI